MPNGALINLKNPHKKDVFIVYLATKNNDLIIYPLIMTNFNEYQVLLNIQLLIDKNRCSIDGFFTDSKTAANDILKYLKNEGIITKNEVAVEIVFKEKNKAA